MIDYSQIGSFQRHVTSLIFSERELYMLSPVRLSSVCDARAQLLIRLKFSAIFLRHYILRES